MPPDCSIGGVASVAPGEALSDVKSLVEQHIIAAVNSDPWLTHHQPNLEWIDRCSNPSLTDSTHPFIKTALSVAEGITGEPSQLTALAGTTDLRFPILYGNIPTIMFGGNRGPIHGPDEYVYIDELSISVRALLQLVTQWCGVY
jgi:acetylornithine deacetylase